MFFQKIIKKKTSHQKLTKLRSKKKPVGQLGLFGRTSVSLGKKIPGTGILNHGTGKNIPGAGISNPGTAKKIPGAGISNPGTAKKNPGYRDFKFQY